MKADGIPASTGLDFVFILESSTTFSTDRRYYLTSHKPGQEPRGNLPIPGRVLSLPPTTSHAGRSAGLRPGVCGAGSGASAGPEAGAPGGQWPDALPIPSIIVPQTSGRFAVRAPAARQKLRA